MSGITGDARESLINEICAYFQGRGKEADIYEQKNTVYLIAGNYEITDRCTQLAELREERNEKILERFLIAKTVKGCTKRTIRYYQAEIKKALDRIGKTVDDITAEDIRYLMAVRQARDHVSKTTADNELRCLRSFFQFLASEELIAKNPTLRIDAVKEKKKQKKAFTEIEIEKLRNVARDEREKAIMEILLSTGCRVSELVNIKIEEIRGDQILIHGKGEKDRNVYLNAKAIVAIENYQKERKDKNPYLFPGGRMISEKKQHRGKKAGWWKEEENVTKDTHYGTGAVEKMMRKLAKKAGIEQANPHKFRRTCATMALRRGMPIEQVSKMLGHEQISTTQIYLDLSEEDLRAAHQKYVI